VVLQLPGLELSETAIGCCVTSFPYVPGLLSFREAPAVLAALENLEDLPDLLMYDGHGLAHPRRFGAASHIGLLTGIPTIGVAKGPLVGGHAPVPPERGAWQPVMAEGEIIGAALRTRSGTRPVYVSIGHRLSLATAIDYVLRCSRGFRLPEPTRWAHQLASGEMLAQTLPPKPSARDALP
jgi:deoxyribonuclease V